MEKLLEMVFNAFSDIKGWNVFELSKWSTNVGFAVKFSVHVEASRNFFNSTAGYYPGGRDKDRHNRKYDV